MQKIEKLDSYSKPASFDFLVEVIVVGDHVSYRRGTYRVTEIFMDENGEVRFGLHRYVRSRMAYTKKAEQTARLARYARKTHKSSTADAVWNNANYWNEVA